VAVSAAVFGGASLRRWLYGGAALLLGLTILLTFSKGALLLGLPAALAVIPRERILRVLLRSV